MAYLRQKLSPSFLEYDDDDNYIMPSRGLKLIALRLYPYDGTRGEDERKASCIQKSLYGKTDWFYFSKGFKIIEKDGNVTTVRVSERAFDTSLLLYSDELSPVINVSAIVGQNGTGKSTIVDMIIRLVNNLSAAILGEGYNYSAAEHLHFIDNVYASLAVYIDSTVKVLTCKGRRMSITTLNVDNLKVLAENYENKNDELVVEHYVHRTTIDILDGSDNEDEILKAKPEFRHILKDWFYTLVSNYSLYAYNYRDYTYELTNPQRFKKQQEHHLEDDKADDACWLKGVFHKNDGYQTPVVVHPMRENGYVNADKVNYLGRQNLISLCFEKRENTLEPFPFRVINKTHHIVAFYFYPESAETYKGFFESCWYSHFDSNDNDEQYVKDTIEPIRRFWEDTIGIDYIEQKSNNNLQKAWDYLVYKTIKVLITYNHYTNIKDAIYNHDKNILLEGLNQLLKDSSHRTQKIRRVVSYIRFYDESSHYMKNALVVDLDDIYDWMNDKIGEQLYPGLDYHEITIEDLLPPPFIDVVLQLVDKEHLEEYRHNQPTSIHIIPFGGLSSGERQIAYTIGNIIYHLKNIESGCNDLNSEQNHVSSLKYRYVNIMLDEVELYFHPDLQRRFISLLLDSIKGLQLKACRGINISLITHSPFVLSDIPSENILSLSRNPRELICAQTFAANIHDLFNNTFFLPYTIGEFAQREITNFLEYYDIARKAMMNHNSWHIIDNEPYPLWSQRIAKYRYLSKIIGDDYIRNEVQDMLNELVEWKMKDNNAESHE